MAQDTVRCLICGGENQPENRFCIHCGRALEAEKAPSAAAGEGEQARAEDWSSIRQEVSQLRQEVAALRDAVMGVVRPAAETEASTPVVTASPPAGGGTAGTGAPPSEPFDPFAFLGQFDWEKLPGNWFARIGGLALIMGAGFFLALAINNDWIGPTGQVTLGIAGGLALMAAGEYWQRRYAVWAQAVMGTGIAILYLSIYAAFGIHELMGTLPSLGILVLITITSGVLSLRHSSLGLAVLAVLGGLFTPLILERDLPDAQLLLLYILVLDLGVLALSTYKNWRWLVIVAAVGSYALFGFWVQDTAGVDLAMEQTGLAMIFGVFVLATTLYHVVWRVTPRYYDLLLMAANAAAYFGINAALLSDRYEDWLPLMSLSMALLYGLLSYTLLWRRGMSSEMTVTGLGIATVFITIAIPLELTGEWITIAWAAEMAVLVWTGFAVRSWHVRVFGLAVAPVVAFRLIFFDTDAPGGPFTLVFNERVMTFALAVAGYYASAAGYWRNRGQSEWWEEEYRPYILGGLLGLANFFTLWIISAEVIRYFNSRVFDFDIDNAIQLTLTILWFLYAGLVLLAGALSKSREARLAGLALMAVVVLKLFLFDSFLLDSGYRVAAFITLGFLLLIIGFLYQRYRSAIKGFFFGTS
ncbi:MAG: DUF2339 domain-containing protein [SAR202 cluster bacterium]|nr:DUF2339 domain-containing protein [SAR202 cluster bacterium]